KREEVTFFPGQPEPVNISRDRDVAPLWDTSADALKPPTPCAGAGAATSSDTPANASGGPTEDTPFGKVTWNRLVRATITSTFRTYCVVFDTGTQELNCALSQAVWTLNVDSKGPAERQHAVVNADAPASADPSEAHLGSQGFLVIPSDFGAA